MWCFVRKCDVAVIGGGIAGYSCAIRLAQKGYNVTLVEKHKIGGECLNYGCIPTKAMYYIANVLSKANEFSENYVKPNFNKIASWRDRIVNTLVSGVEYLLKSYNIEVIYGIAKLKEHNELYIGKDVIEFKKLVIATGSDPLSLRGFEYDGRYILNNRDLARLQDLPESILIVGGGAIGVEYASIFAKLGVEVILVEIMPQLLPGMDSDLSRIIERGLKNLGVKVVKGTTIKSIEKKVNYVEVKLGNGSMFKVNCIAIAIGRKPNTAGIGLELLNVELNSKGYVKVNKHMQTTNPTIFAAGDVAGPPLLAHKALIQGIVVAENIQSPRSTIFNENLVPIVIFSEPELASIGLSTEQAKNLGVFYKNVKVPLTIIARALIENGSRGFIKFVLGKNNEVLGIHMAGPHVSEVISAALPVIMKKLRIEEMAFIPYPHPTVSEALREISELILGNPLHIVLRK
ncbi:MAG: dihydrolipoyl dehydrogenase [Thermoprotei archaeon]|nr:MAG: dihydrolipoyl dehydrogenase [Thermoprotei archaeon]